MAVRAHSRRDVLISATSSSALNTTTQSLKAETQAYVTACYKACQWHAG